MKILSIHPTALLSPDSHNMARVFGRLAENGHEVHAVLPEAGPLVPLLEARGIRVHLHPGLSILKGAPRVSTGAILRLLVTLPSSIFFLVRLIRALQVDVVHSNSLRVPSPSLAAFLTGIPHVWHVRELPQFLGRIWRTYQHCVHHLSSAIVTASACVRDQFDPSLHDRIQVVHDGIDAPPTVPNPIVRALFPPDALIIGVVAPLEGDRYGQEVVIRAASLLHERAPNARFVLVGSPAPGSAAPGQQGHETRLRELISTCALDDVVKLLPDTGDPAAAFAAMDIAVVPSLHPEPVCPAVLHAMATATPVIGSRTGVIAEQVVPYETGLLFTPGNAEELSRDIFLLLHNPALRIRMAEAGRRRVRTHFALETCSGAMTRLFDQLLYPEATLTHPAAPTARATKV